MKLIKHTALIATISLLAACSCLKQGAVVSKHARGGLPALYADETLYRYPEPDAYWIVVKGHGPNGRLSVRNVLLSRKQWLDVRVGDFWSSAHGIVHRGGDGKEGCGCGNK